MTISAFLNELNTKTLGRNCFLFNSINSTSTYIRERFCVLPHGTAVISTEQLSGRGRTGKSFYSPKGEGLYFSLVLKEEKYITDPLFTVKMSYALCKAIDTFTKTDCVKIKWVNDIYHSSKKLAGILCEMVNLPSSKGIILGMGINTRLDKGNIPTELKNKICSLFDVTKSCISSEILLSRILSEIEKIYDLPVSQSDFISQYRSRSAILGKEIAVIKDGTEVRAAALDIAGDAGLIVRYQNGITEKLTAGEVSIILKQK